MTSPTSDETPETRLAMIDGRDALAFVIIRPSSTNPDTVTVEASSRGMPKAAAAYALRNVAARFDAEAIAEGDEPIPYPNATEPPSAATATASEASADPARGVRSTGVPRPRGLDALLNHVAAHLPDNEEPHAQEANQP
ncbi:hypothetical protein [Streptomyces cavernae]|uniref:hypothetical protein n=1 Tax=Streptomyces cavernae TaxID=2259034 RepID=UPI00192E454C|nr:hypothetical protein [Streptomyces cavernae]